MTLDDLNRQIAELEARCEQLTTEEVALLNALVRQRIQLHHALRR